VGAVGKLGNRLRNALLLFPAVLVGGTLSYHLVEGWGYFDSFYMTVITVSTVGFREVRELSAGGRMLTLALIIVGISVLAYAGSGLMEDLVENRIRRMLGRRRLEKTINHFKNHIIVCGYGRMGRMLAEELAGLKQQFVVVEMDARRTALAEESNHIYVLGDARSESVLQAAGIDHARALVAALATDADNLLVTLTAKGLEEELTVVSRCESPEKEKNFRRAGAGHVISPQAIGARRAAYVLVKPHVSDFIDVATRSGNVELVIDQTEIRQGSVFAGRSLQESDLRRQTGLIVLAIKKSDGQMVFNPPPESILEVGDTLVTVGGTGGHDVLHPEG
jgi:voltage-gated potassium channel